MKKEKFCSTRLISVATGLLFITGITACGSSRAPWSPDIHDYKDVDEEKREQHEVQDFFEQQYERKDKSELHDTIFDVQQTYDQEQTEAKDLELIDTGIKDITEQETTAEVGETAGVEVGIPSELVEVGEIEILTDAETGETLAETEFIEIHELEAEAETCGECGDGVCDWCEDTQNCPEDCLQLYCGDGICSEVLDENCSSCPQDCGPCCGNAQCEQEEDCQTCPEDCGECSTCGDGILDDGEECDDACLKGEQFVCEPGIDDGDGCSYACKLDCPECGFPIGDIVITEIMKDPKYASDQVGEWFEVKNLSDYAVDLQGWTLQDQDVDFHIIQPTQPLIIPPGGIIVLARYGDPLMNGGVDADYVYDSFILGNTKDEIMIIAPDGTVADEVIYDSSFPSESGHSMSLSADSYDSAANDIANNWCPAVDMMVNGDFGTPGLDNPPCTPPAVCGNGIKEEGEECDDGCMTGIPNICEPGVDDNDGCDWLCKIECEGICGNGIVECSEQCDDGCDKGEPGVCEPGIDDGDGCDAQCNIEGECGNGLVEAGEQCDDGNLENGDGCSDQCEIEYYDPLCGDGKVEGTEQCDDGCMNGYPNVCEEGIDDGDGCSHECEFENFINVCGNAINEEENGEQCDDGCMKGQPWICEPGIDDGDGCSHDCMIEVAVSCTPSPCCGDLNVDEGEECDDGNTVDGDGCSHDCKIETAETQGIKGTVLWAKQAGPDDTLDVLAFDEAVEDPYMFPAIPVGAAHYAPVVFPQQYFIKDLPAGEYWVVALLDIGGNNPQSIGAEDIAVVYSVDGQPTPVTVVENEVVSGIDMKLPDAPMPKVGTVSGTVFYNGTVTQNDRLYLFLSSEFKGDSPPLYMIEVKPVQFPHNFSFQSVAVGQYYVGARLDVNDDNPQSMGEEDFLGWYPDATSPQKVEVKADQESSGINFALVDLSQGQ